MRCRFGLKRRLVATIEWLRLFPKEGFFPQIEQTLDTAAAESSEPTIVGYVAGSPGKSGDRKSRSGTCPFGW